MTFLGWQGCLHACSGKVIAVLFAAPISKPSRLQPAILPALQEHPPGIPF
ncbi:hypothetical protein QWZ08_00280 [Ferruginibacter paludis]|nr:hypothetical protein [Ferruginibacter paludis]MDN3654037.1 hypothetical protein [Ferruginibacter paludis]